jgi:hypothetical protein
MAQSARVWFSGTMGIIHLQLSNRSILVGVIDSPYLQERVYLFFIVGQLYEENKRHIFSPLCGKIPPKMGAIYPVASNFFLGVNWRGIKATN